MAVGDLELRIAWQRHVGADDLALQHLDAVTARYREAHRRYHDLRHVRWVVRHVTDLARGRELSDLAAVVAAAFFHDAIYDARASDNEAASAELARGSLGECGWTSSRLDVVSELVIGTAWHDLTTASTDAAVLYAADLAVLAASPTKYDDYVRNVRQEYVHVSDVDWVEGRSRVLTSLLERPSIYADELGLDDWEARARGNMAAELRSLGV